MMHIEVGLQYSNKTFNYLLPLFRAYGEEFVKKLSQVFKLAAGVYDDTIDQEFKNEKCVFILVNNAYLPHLYNQFLSYITSHSSYLHHYTTNTPHQTMFILTIPESYHSSYDAFIKGEYSKMFEDDEEIDLLLPGNSRKEANNVCKRKVGQTVFINKINKEFGTEITNFDAEINEFELPLKSTVEVFNCKKQRSVFYNPKE